MLKWLIQTRKGARRHINELFSQAILIRLDHIYQVSRKNSFSGHVAVENRGSKGLLKNLDGD